jgi:hypothetical protein
MHYSSNAFPAAILYRQADASYSCDLDAGSEGVRIGRFDGAAKECGGRTASIRGCVWMASTKKSVVAIGYGEEKSAPAMLFALQEFVPNLLVPDLLTWWEG